ncbi:multidrug effflux MFS transporter [Gayadomonas joobiniege]|uniref:multidrug effflux MFS transporter n=1 Tax=Gayadomonas joobiniege TaxID=1234606 RepID=UPI000360CD87|nr:multidrug effflux MFS transporter [Gayadomonas joobiniege]
MQKNISVPMTLLLAAIFSISPLAIDTYLPAITEIASDLSTQTENVSITVSLYVMGMAFGQLIGGPLSDRFGRSSVMQIGIGVFILGSLLLAIASTVEQLWIFRMLQALGGGISAVCVPALIRDHVTGAAAAKLLSLITLVMMLAPAVAPSIGSLMLAFFNWHAIFIFLALVASSIFICIRRLLPASAQTEHGTKKTHSISYLIILKNVAASRFLFTQAMGFSVLMIFLSSSAMIYMEYFELEATEFSSLFLLNVASIAIINRVNARLLNRYRPEQLLKCFVGLQIFGGLLLLTVSYFFSTNLILAVLGFAITVSAISAIGPNATACYLAYYEHNAGKASALLGFAKYALGASISAVTAYAYNDSIQPVAVSVLLCASLSFIALICYREKKQRT